MAIINPSLPTIGGQRGDGESALRNDIVAILAELNGNLDTTNVRDASLRSTDMDSGVPVSALPVAPYDGQEIDFIADAALGAVWRLKYRAGSASAFKWEFRGGASMYITSLPGGSLVAANGYAGLNANNLQMALPLNGDYEVDWRSFGQSDTVGSILQCGMYGPTPDFDAAAFANNAALITANAINTGYQLTGFMNITGLNGTRVIEQRFLTSAGTATFGRKYIRARPIRVG